MRFFLSGLFCSAILVLAGCATSSALGGSRSIASLSTMRRVPAGRVILRGEALSVRALAVDRVAVTVRDYGDFAASARRPPRRADAEEGVSEALRAAHAFDGIDPPSRYLAHPMVAVDHDEARDYCAWRGSRLPTEAEWTRAVYGDDSRAFPWGDLADATRANSREFGAADTVPVLTHSRGAGPFELADGVGQVREWTATRVGSGWAVVGSSWRDPLLARERLLLRSERGEARSLTLGFRCVRDVEG